MPSAGTMLRLSLLLIAVLACARAQTEGDTASEPVAPTPDVPSPNTGTGAATEPPMVETVANGTDGTIAGTSDVVGTELPGVSTPMATPAPCTNCVRGACDVSVECVDGQCVRKTMASGAGCTDIEGFTGTCSAAVREPSAR